MSFLLFDDPPIAINPKLATILGVNEAIFLQQLHYWLRNKSQNADKYIDSFKNGHWWVYNSLSEWLEQMPYLGSESSIKRIIQNLKENGLIIIERHNKQGFDKTNWYRINYLRLDQVYRQTKSSDRSGQNDPTIRSNWTDGSGQIGLMDQVKMTRPIPETSQRLHTETSTDIDLVHQDARQPDQNQLSLFSDEEFNAELRRRSGDNSLSISNVSNSDRSDLPGSDCGKVDNSGKKVLPRGGHAPEAFAAFWEQYPVKKGKVHAQKAWNALKANSELVSTIMHDLSNRKQNDRQWVEGFVPHASTYLNGQRWEDEIEPLTNKKTGVKSKQTQQESEEEKRNQARINAVRRLRGEI